MNYRIGWTFNPSACTFAHVLSAVNAGLPSWIANAMQLRSPRPLPAVRVDEDKRAAAQAPSLLCALTSKRKVSMISWAISVEAPAVQYLRPNFF
jgi:hypothetical protein